MAKRPLKIVGVDVRGPMPPRAAAVAAPGAEAAPPPEGQQHRNLAVNVENPGDNTLHVWASRRAYDYDPATRVLTMYLTEHVPPPPPETRMISDHPRTPLQVEVPPKGRVTFEVPVPDVIRRRVPSRPGRRGMAFSETPIGPIDRVELHVQSATEPFVHIAHEDPVRHRERLRAHGEVVHATLTPTARKE